AVWAGADAGEDLLCAEAMLERKNAALHLVLPWAQEEFRRTNVAPFEPADGSPAIWEPLLDRALREAATVRGLGGTYEPGSDVTAHYTMEVIAGLALHVARASRLDVTP